MTTRDNTRVMKRFAAESASGRIAFNFEDVVQRLEDYKAEVKEQCRQEILLAAQDGELLRQQARADGHSEGYRHGLRQAELEIEQRSQQLAETLVEQRLQTVLPAISAVLDELTHASSRCQAEWEQELVNVSLAIAEKLVRTELKAHAERLGAIVEHALQLVVGQTSIVIHLHPQDIAGLGDRVRAIVQHARRGLEVKLTPDETVSPGGCIITTAHGRIDARLETMLQRIGEELVEGT